MKPQYEGKSPGRLWYAWQRSRAFTKTLTSKSTRSSAKSFGRNTGLSAASLTGGWLVWYSGMSFFGIPGLLIGTGVVAAVVFGRKAFLGAKDLKRSSTYLDFMRNQENKWVVKQGRPRLMARIKSLFTRAGTVLGYALTAAGAALATTAGLQMGGVISSAALTTVLGSVAAAVSLPVIIGVAAAAIPLGIVSAIVCRKATRRLLGIKPGEKKPTAPVQAIEAKNDNKSAIKNQSATSSFTSSATVTKQSVDLSEDRKKAAEERLRDKKKGPQL